MKKIVIIICFLLLLSQNAFSERISISKVKVNIRSGPGTNYDVVTLIENAQNYPLDVLKKNGNWYQIKDYKNYTGWIYKTLVSTRDTVITEIDDCSIRKGPGLNYEIVIIANKDVCLKVITKKGKWIKVEYQAGAQGWIHHSLVW